MTASCSTGRSPWPPTRTVVGAAAMLRRAFGDGLSAARMLQRSMPGWDKRGRTPGPATHGALVPHEASLEPESPKRS
eukprot:13381470-Alexandrium_andersonii.AAC.1